MLLGYSVQWPSVFTSIKNSQTHLGLKMLHQILEFIFEAKLPFNSIELSLSYRYNGLIFTTRVSFKFSKHFKI